MSFSVITNEEKNNSNESIQCNIRNNQSQTSNISPSENNNNFIKNQEIYEKKQIQQENNPQSFKNELKSKEQGVSSLIQISSMLVTLVIAMLIMMYVGHKKTIIYPPSTILAQVGNNTTVITLTKGQDYLITFGNQTYIAVQVNSTYISLTEEDIIMNQPYVLFPE